MKETIKSIEKLLREEGQFEGSPPTKETFARHQETIKRMKEEWKIWKNELKITFQTPDQPELGFNSPTWSDMSKQEPKWLPMSSAPKCGSPITVNQSTNKRHKIFKANWSLNKWYSLYEEGNNEEVYPEFWLEGSKEEPQIDMKKESVEPVSIWKDNKDELKKLEKQNEKFLIRTKDGRVIMPIISNYFSSDNQIDKNIKEATTLTDFINSFEQERLKRLDMEARLRKLEGK